ncbi:MAG: SUMF1/EgtB/PvdO family nonheme iron enzyme [Candidatus Saganbacteria bacterium]|nr:SUMF1/EgtB/PvdO family nonheme iron enzyme [Candidatus Saganbacteria bacterium]
MHKLKLISFNMVDSLEGLGLPEIASLRARVEQYDSEEEAALIRDLRLCGIAISKPTLERIFGAGNVESILQALRVIEGVEIPEMIDMGTYRIMKYELTVGQFKQFVEDTGYEIKGHGAQKLKDLLGGGNRDAALVCVSLLDARVYAEWLTKKTGRNFRVQTKEEGISARDKLSGDNLTWTETRHNEVSFVLRRLGGDHRSCFPDNRYEDQAVRLVEDK